MSIFALDNSPIETMEVYHGGEQLITFSSRIIRPCGMEYEHIFRIENLEQTIEYELFNDKIPDSHLFVQNIYFIQNGKKYYPEKLILIYKNVEIIYYGACIYDLLKHNGNLFIFPLLFNSDIKINKIDENIEIYVEILSTPKTHPGLNKRYNDFWASYKKIQILSHYKIILDNSNNLQDEITINGNMYINKVYLFCDDVNNISNVSLRSNKIIFYENISSSLICYTNHCLMFRLGIKKGEHGFYLDKDDKLKINFTILDKNKPSNFECIVEKCGLFGITKPDKNFLSL